MANIKGLNLEFEDEEEQKRKKKEAIDVDVDSLFNADSESAKKAKPASNTAGTKPNVQAKTPAQKPQAPSNVQQLRPKANATPKSGTPSGPTSARSAPATSSGGSNEGFEQFQVELFREMKQQIQVLQDEVVKLKSESLSKDAISDFKIKTLVEMMTSAKMLDNGLNQVINRIAAKAPALKNELLQMKKIIAEFNQGVEKIKNDSSKKSG
ncbi:hypothetical protein N9N67_12515 [Bacteriovoracaceae bacterium]|nr:hypothetical protein [Bacteriovoracaceae bacterium]